MAFTMHNATTDQSTYINGFIPICEFSCNRPASDNGVLQTRETAELAVPKAELLHSFHKHDLSHKCEMYVIGYVHTRQIRKRHLPVIVTSVAVISVAKSVISTNGQVMCVAIVVVIVLRVVPTRWRIITLISEMIPF